MAGIDRINSYIPTDGSLSEQSRRVRGQDTSETGAFQLDDREREGVIYEPSSPERPAKTMSQIKEELAKEAAEETRSRLHTRFDGPGVAVELSHESFEAVENERLANASILEKLKEALDAVKNFFVELWTGGGDEEKIDTSVNPKYDTVSQNNWLGNDPETIAAFMVDYGGRRLAKNSDLLTQYDSRGRITTPGPSDRRRILQGDGNIRHY